MSWVGWGVSVLHGVTNPVPQYAKHTFSQPSELSISLVPHFMKRKNRGLQGSLGWESRLKAGSQVQPFELHLGRTDQPFPSAQSQHRV